MRHRIRRTATATAAGLAAALASTTVAAPNSAASEIDLTCNGYFTVAANQQACTELGRLAEAGMRFVAVAASDTTDPVARLSAGLTAGVTLDTGTTVKCVLGESCDLAAVIAYTLFSDTNLAAADPDAIVGMPDDGDQAVETAGCSGGRCDNMLVYVSAVSRLRELADDGDITALVYGALNRPRPDLSYAELIATLASTINQAAEALQDAPGTLLRLVSDVYNLAVYTYGTPDDGVEIQRPSGTTLIDPDRKIIAPEPGDPQSYWPTTCVAGFRWGGSIHIYKEKFTIWYDAHGSTWANGAFLVDGLYQPDPSKPPKLCPRPAFMVQITSDLVVNTNDGQFWIDDWRYKDHSSSGMLPLDTGDNGWVEAETHVRDKAMKLALEIGWPPEIAIPQSEYLFSDWYTFNTLVSSGVGPYAHPDWYGTNWTDDFGCVNSKPEIQGHSTYCDDDIVRPE